MLVVEDHPRMQRLLQRAFTAEGLPVGNIKEQFRAARVTDYAALLEEIGKPKPTGGGKIAQSARWRKRFEEIAIIDFFQSPCGRAWNRHWSKLNSGTETRKNPRPARFPKLRIRIVRG